ncbi:MAG: isoprenylcysteine carboxylmethyltransferase family protein [Candidatus Omnitrophota bacterium]
MKKRIQMDITLLVSFVIVLTIVFVKFPRLYIQDAVSDDLLDFIGFLTILKGILVRMTARGYKKSISSRGENLVTDGPYSIVRNPMYLGSFYIGCGFVLILWPWWALPLFAAVFYLRFRRQISSEEKYLKAHFGKTFDEYVSRVPRLIPSWKSIKNANIKESFPLDKAWLTKEKWGLISWTFLAIFLEALREYLVFGSFDIVTTAQVFSLSALTFILVLIVWYNYAPNTK